MTVRHDPSSTGIVTTCSDCPHWASFSFGQDEADRRATAHKVNVHGIPEARAARAAADREAKRAQRERARHAVTA